jgi:uncharacterized glyoxalase superfamily protein PhnB
MASKKKARKSANTNGRTRAARPPGRRQPETLRLRGISPSFTANDLQRSIAFYRDVLGFVVGDEWRGESGVLQGCEMHAGSVVFVLNQDDFAKGRDRMKGLGTRLHVSTAQDIDRLASEIKARGGTLDQEPADMPWGERVFMITDPDGFKLTIAQAR